jgi:hypothetical protein
METRPAKILLALLAQEHHGTAAAITRLSPAVRALERAGLIAAAATVGRSDFNTLLTVEGYAAVQRVLDVQRAGAILEEFVTPHGAFIVGPWRE